MPAETEDTLVIENRLEELSRVERWLSPLLEQWAVPAKATFTADLVINEAVTNVIRHGYSDEARHEISISLTNTGQGVRIELIDDGIPFNPLDAPAMAVGQDLEQAAIGGRGIHLIKQYADEHHYDRVDGLNHLTLTVYSDG